MSLYTNYYYSDFKRSFLDKRNKSIKGKKIDIIQFGDSITENFNLQRYGIINKTVINSGISGDISSTALQRIDNDVISLKPEKVVLMIGINDIRTFFQNKKHAYQVKNEDELVKVVSLNIIKILRKLLDSNIKVIYNEILPLNQGDFNSFAANRLIRAINIFINTFIDENEMNVTIIKHDNLILDNGLLDLNKAPDGLHPNDYGYIEMFNNLMLELIEE